MDEDALFSDAEIEEEIQQDSFIEETEVDKTSEEMCQLPVVKLPGSWTSTRFKVINFLCRIAGD